MKQSHVEIVLIIVNIILLLYLVYCYTIGDRFESFHEVSDETVPHNHYDGTTDTPQNSGCVDDGNNNCVQTAISPSAQLYIDAEGIRDELFAGFQTKETLLDEYKGDLITRINTEITNLNNNISQGTITDIDIDTCFDNIHTETVIVYDNIYTHIMNWLRLKEEAVKAKDDEAQDSNDVSTDIKNAISDIRSEVRTKSIDLYNRVLLGLYAIISHIFNVGIDTDTTFAQASLNKSEHAESVIDNSLSYADYIDQALSRLESAKQAQLYATCAQMVANTLARIGFHAYQKLYVIRVSNVDRNVIYNNLFALRQEMHPLFEEDFHDLILDHTRQVFHLANTKTKDLRSAVEAEIVKRSDHINKRKNGESEGYEDNILTDLTQNQNYTQTTQSASSVQNANVYRVINEYIDTYLYDDYFQRVAGQAYSATVSGLTAPDAQTAATDAQTAAISAYDHVMSDEFLNATSQFMLGEPGANCDSDWSYFEKNDETLCKTTAKQWLNEELKSIITSDFTVNTVNDTSEIKRLRCHVGGVSISEPWIRWNTMPDEVFGLTTDLTNGSPDHRPVCKKI